MKNTFTKQTKNNQTSYYAGVGLPFGAALGLFFGLLFFSNWVMGLVIGAAVGLLACALIDILNRR